MTGIGHPNYATTATGQDMVISVTGLHGKNPQPTRVMALVILRGETAADIGRSAQLTAIAIPVIFRALGQKTLPRNNLSRRWFLLRSAGMEERNASEIQSPAEGSGRGPGRQARRATQVEAEGRVEGDGRLEELASTPRKGKPERAAQER